MANLVVDEQNRIPKEALLLGNVEVTITDCEGNQVQVHGLTGNDLVVKHLDGTSTPLVPFIESIATGGIIIVNSVITLADGSTTTMQQMAEDIPYIYDSI